MLIVYNCIIQELTKTIYKELKMTDELKKEEQKKDSHICGCKTEVYSRVTGYYRPVSNWNKGKQEEFKDRKRFTVPNTCCCAVK